MLDVFTEESGRGGRVCKPPPSTTYKNKTAIQPINPQHVPNCGRREQKNNPTCEKLYYKKKPNHHKHAPK
ncbi:hypothetical protein [Enterobacter hormaechei]